MLTPVFSENLGSKNFINPVSISTGLANNEKSRAWDQAASGEKNKSAISDIHRRVKAGCLQSAKGALKAGSRGKYPSIAIKGE
ncbi:MAG: hypothetical protein ACC634_05235 [Hyphomicrobiales bacterium]